MRVRWTLPMLCVSNWAKYSCESFKLSSNHARRGLATRSRGSISRPLSSSSRENFDPPERQTVASVYESSRKYLNAAGVPDADISARYLICEAAKLGYRLSDFNKNQQRELGSDEIKAMQEFCEKRIARVPVQYIIGNWDFFGLTLECVEPVLIPRPETEELVEMIVESNADRRDTPLRILDIGCGTGAIGLALLSQFPQAKCTAIDVSDQATSLAMRNARSVLGVGIEGQEGLDGASRYQVKHVAFMDFVREQMEVGEEAGERFDIIVSNPPYIPSSEMVTLQSEVRLYEDHGALHGGVDGLDIVRQIIRHGPCLFAKDVHQDRCDIWLEVSESHPEVVKAALGDEGDAPNADKELYAYVEALNDLSGNPRFVRLRRAAP